MFKIFPNFSAQGLPSDDLFGLQMDVCQFGNNGKEGDDDGTELESISGKSGLVCFYSKSLDPNQHNNKPTFA